MLFRSALRADLTDADVADLLWSTNSPEWFTAYTSRGRTADEYAAALGDLWSRTLVDGGSSEQEHGRHDAGGDDGPAEDGVRQQAADAGADVATDQ